MIPFLVANAILISYVATTTLGIVFIKYAGETGAPISFVDGKIHFNIGLYAVLGMFFYGVSFLLYTYLIAKNDLSYIIPVATALVYIGIFLASFFLFKEAMTALKVVGILLIIGGVILLNVTTASKRSDVKSEDKNTEIVIKKING